MNQCGKKSLVSAQRVCLQLFEYKVQCAVLSISHPSRESFSTLMGLKSGGQVGK